VLAHEARNLTQVSAQLPVEGLLLNPEGTEETHHVLSTESDTGLGTTPGGGVAAESRGHRGDHHVLSTTVTESDHMSRHNCG
jgi:hypothetical protein